MPLLQQLPWPLPPQPLQDNSATQIADPPSHGQDQQCAQKNPAQHTCDIDDLSLEASPFLSSLTTKQNSWFEKARRVGPDVAFLELLDQVKQSESTATDFDYTTIAQTIRQQKQAAALLIALCDLSSRWDHQQTVTALSDFADSMVRITTFYAMKGHTCGYVLFALGKLGGRDLNYSSDLDLIAIYDPDQITLPEPKGPAGTATSEGLVSLPAVDPSEARKIAVKTTQMVASLLSDRDRNGYVFRTDFRLRPDPSSTAVAIGYDAAITYYESVGQNWERAAWIRARPVAGDLAMGQRFLEELRPFIWRLHLDYPAIRDISSIRRQMFSYRGVRGGMRTSEKVGNTDLASIAGFDLKLGEGGIREIEFLGQTCQLIWGGRNPDLRKNSTLETLRELVRADLLEADDETFLNAAYRCLRALEHRIQMVADQQNHRLPSGPALETFAAFCGQENADVFANRLVAMLERVHEICRNRFSNDEEDLGVKEGSLVFTGTDDHPDTLKTLAAMGYRSGEQVVACVQEWHRGGFRSTRSTLARQLLTELTPRLLGSLAHNPNPDRAFAHFHQFLIALPAGIQIFSLLREEMHLLDLLAVIMGSAPNISQQIAKRPDLLDALLDPTHVGVANVSGPASGDHDTIPVNFAEDYESILLAARKFRLERVFLAEIALLTQRATTQQVQTFLTRTAEITIPAVLERTAKEYLEQTGRSHIEDWAVLGFGSIGSAEMLPNSDLDLVYVRDGIQDENVEVEGDSGLHIESWFGRLGRRWINAFEAQTPFGYLYRVDCRLRPGGLSAHLVPSFSRFRSYYLESEEAWLWELMALTRARPIAGSPKLCARLTETIRWVLCRKRDRATVVSQALDMRARVQKEFPGQHELDMKYTRGGLMDLDYAIRVLQLNHASERPTILAANPEAALRTAHAENILTDDLYRKATKARSFLMQIWPLVQLISTDVLPRAPYPQEIQNLFCRAVRCKDMESFRDELHQSTQAVLQLWAFAFGQERD